MKKVLAICLMIIMVASLSVTALAAPHGFVSSPSGGKRPPVLDFFDPVDNDCTGELVVTPYGDKNELNDDERKAMEDAYNDIVNSGKLTDLNKELEDAAKDKGINGKDLAVGDLFHLGCKGCSDHDKHEKYKVSLDVEGLDRFVGVIYRDENGDWQWVKDAKVENGKLHFTGEGYHPYAVVLDNSKPKPPAGTGDIEIIAICAAVMAVSAAALVIVLVKGKKQHA